MSICCSSEEIQRKYKKKSQAEAGGGETGCRVRSPVLEVWWENWGLEIE